MIRDVTIIPRLVIAALTALTFTGLSLGPVGAAPHAPDRVIVRFVKAVDGPRALADPQRYEIQETLAPRLNLYLVRLRGGISVPTALRALRSDPSVMYAQPDHRVVWHGTPPNDPRFYKQWHLQNLGEATYADIVDGSCEGCDATGDCSCNFLCKPLKKCCYNACQACGTCVGTPGLDIDAILGWTHETDAGDHVLAIVDSGFDLSHPDLAANVWKNPGEIPGNGVDDDGNGYVDDLHGWDAAANTGTLTVDGHGTAVFGVAAARGDNGIGVAGVAWRAKVMLLSTLTDASFTSTVIKAYNYILTQREMWNASGGLVGARVVVTNSSFGIPGVSCAAFPAWNDLYEAMGEVGILSVVAANNDPVDIDSTQELPAGCASPYVISVTEMTTEGGLEAAGYGAKSVDLAAPGKSIHTTQLNGTYETVNGTSFAAPQVAAGVALMHAAAPTSDGLCARPPALERARSAPARLAPLHRFEQEIPAPFLHQRQRRADRGQRIGDAPLPYERGQAP